MVRWLAVALVPVLVACGAKSQLIAPVLDVVDVTDATFVRDGCTPVADECGPVEVCGNGLDDNCNGQVDEECPCNVGEVQSCFGGPPGRRHIGICRDGQQVCLSTRGWGACTGDVRPGAPVCNGTDNQCNGCSAQPDCPITCPSPGDMRVPDGTPYNDYPLRGELFYPGAASRWNWRVVGGPCDAITQAPSFTLRDGNARDATLFPVLSGDYTVTLTIVTAAGTTLSCTWVVHVAGPGVRVEMCYPENTSVDLDLYVHRPGSTQDWYPDAMSVFQPLADSCNWSNCEAHLRAMVPNPVRADWGYAPSPLSACENGPLGTTWQSLGFCANPRLDIDNNLDEASGRPENINIDDPRDADSFRIMVQNFTGTIAHPMVNVYCNGSRVASFGVPPDRVPMFQGMPPPNIGAMWRVADVIAHVQAGTTRCEIRPLHPNGRTSGFLVTYGDPTF